MNNDTCLIERSAVREILTTSDANNDATAQMLADIDALPIATVGTMREALAGAREALIRSGFVGPSANGTGDPEINAIDEALAVGQLTKDCDK